jgi:hypothetical protein
MNGIFGVLRVLASLNTYKVALEHEICLSVSTRGDRVLSHPVYRQHCMPGASGEATSLYPEAANRAMSHA